MISRISVGITLFIAGEKSVRFSDVRGSHVTLLSMVQRITCVRSNFPEMNCPVVKIQTVEGVFDTYLYDHKDLA